MEPGLQLAIALVVLIGIAVVVSWRAKLGTVRAALTAAVRAALQLAAVSFVIVGALQHLALAFGFVAVMAAVAVITTARRLSLGRAWPWAAAAVVCGVAPVLLVIFALGVVPLTGIALIPIAGILIGAMMTAHTLTGRRLFSALRDEHGQYEAALAIGLPRTEAITEITRRHTIEAMVPALDQTRTVGLVTLPGAFVGVLLGGGSPAQAGAAQLLVLVGILAGQAITVALAHRFIAAAKLLPADLRASLRP